MKCSLWSFKRIGWRVAPLITLGMAALVLAGCDNGNNDFSVKTDYDKRVSFSQYHTFAFQKGRLVSRLGTSDPNNTLVDGRIHDAVVNQLTAKGLQLNTQNPDLVATYIAGARSKQEVEDLGPEPYDSPYFGGRFGFRHGDWWGAGYDQFYINTYTQGTLILDLIDPKTKQLVWRAYVTGQIDQPDEKTVNKAVSSALKNFPPAPKN
ncbi:MAG: DUF4136 domain-containing protein [Janthinobacterium lividum]